MKIFYKVMKMIMKRIRVQILTKMKDLHTLKKEKRKGLISLKKMKAKVNITTSKSFIGSKKS
jgi:hypothetical protein